MRLHDAVTITTATSKARRIILSACTCDCPATVTHTTGMPLRSNAALLLLLTWSDLDADCGTLLLASLDATCASAEAFPDADGRIFLGILVMLTLFTSVRQYSSVCTVP